jgi:hypothetical protein
MNVVCVLLYFFYGGFCNVVNDKNIAYISCIVDDVSGFYEVFNVYVSNVL